MFNFGLKQKIVKYDLILTKGQAMIEAIIWWIWTWCWILIFLP